MLQRVDDEKIRRRIKTGRVGVHLTAIGMRDPTLRMTKSGGEGGHLNVPAFLVVGTLEKVTAGTEGLFSRNPVKIVRKSWT